MLIRVLVAKEWYCVSHLIVMGGYRHGYTQVMTHPDVSVGTDDISMDTGTHHQDTDVNYE